MSMANEELSKSHLCIAIATQRDLAQVKLYNLHIGSQADITSSSSSCDTRFSQSMSQPALTEWSLHDKICECQSAMEASIEKSTSGSDNSVSTNNGARAVPMRRFRPRGLGRPYFTGSTKPTFSRPLKCFRLTEVAILCTLKQF